MVMNPIPPQAYTKDTLVQAYAWLQHQTNGIKEMATNPDILVSLFLKAQRQGDESLERPSIQNFKTELKNLAGMMGELEGNRAQNVSPSSSPAQNQVHAQSHAHTQNPPHSQHLSAPQTHTQPAHRAPLGMPQTAGQASHSQYPHHRQNAEVRQTIETMDPRSLAMIQEVKNLFNLSQDQEALRLLISVGFNQLKTLIK